MSVVCGVDRGWVLLSRAQFCFALSICLRLLIQAFVCDVERAWTKLGIAMAARRPIMATTIMISINVKPSFLDCLGFITAISGLNAATGSYN